MNGKILRNRLVSEQALLILVQNTLAFLFKLINVVLDHSRFHELSKLRVLSRTYFQQKTKTLNIFLLELASDNYFKIRSRYKKTGV